MILWEKGARVDSVACRVPHTSVLRVGIFSPSHDRGRKRSSSAQADTRYPSANKTLKVILDILYQYGIMASLGRHDSFPPFLPCPPVYPEPRWATRSFYLLQYLSACPYSVGVEDSDPVGTIPLNPILSYRSPTPTP